MQCAASSAQSARARFRPRHRAYALALVLVAAPAAARTLGSVEFEPCTLTAEGRPTSLAAECARLEVPENPQAPDGRRLSLSMALVPASGPRPHEDLVVFLAGGPGQAALDSFPLIEPAFERILRDRHVLLVDSRGTGGSNALRCPFDDAISAADMTREALERHARDCLERIDDRADPRWYSTRDAVRDLETVRAALGAPMLNLVGGSYGTRVALSYLAAYPQSVRSVVLDGVVPQDLALGQDHARNLENALRKLSDHCSADAACRERHGDVLARLGQLRRQLSTEPIEVELRHPVTHEPRRERLDRYALAGVARMFPYSPQAAVLLPLLVDEALAGRPQPLVAQSLLLTEGLDERIAHGMQLSVMCAEDAPLLELRPEDADTFLGNSLIELAQAQCAVWPHRAFDPAFKQPLRSDVPALLLSGEWDPVTPPAYAERVLQHLSNARHLVARGQGHIVIGAGCMPKLAAEFVDTLDPAALDTGCLALLGPPPVWLSFQGPQP